MLSVLSVAPVLPFTSPRSTRLKLAAPLTRPRPVSAGTAPVSVAAVAPLPTFTPNSLPPARPACSTALPVALLLPTYR